MNLKNIKYNDNKRYFSNPRIPQMGRNTIKYFSVTHAVILQIFYSRAVNSFYFKFRKNIVNMMIKNKFCTVLTLLKLFARI